MPVPAVITTKASFIAVGSIQFEGEVNAHNEATKWWVEYGVTPGLGRSTEEQIAANDNIFHGVAWGTTPLKSNTLHYYRIAAQNASGTAVGSTLTASTTAPGAPVVVTAAASPVTRVNAGLRGTSTEEGFVSDEGFGDERWYEWGLTTGYGKSSLTFKFVSTAESIFEAEGLTPNTTYHYRMVARNVTGTTNGSDKTFKTEAVKVPTVTTEGNFGIQQREASLEGKAVSNGATTETFFEVGPTTGYGKIIGSGTIAAESSGPIRDAQNNYLRIAGLLPSTVYHYRAAGKNSAGTGVGVDKTFATPALGTPIAYGPPSAEAEERKAKLTGRAQAEGLPIQLWWDYGRTEEYGLSTPHVLVPTEEEPNISTVITGLTPNTKYHFRLQVKQVGGSPGTSVDETFTTGKLLAPGERLYASVPSVFAKDEEVGFFGKRLCEALMSMFQEVDGIVRDAPAGTEPITEQPLPESVKHCGWSAILDPESCPEAWVPWCARLYGITLRGHTSVEEQRVQIRELGPQQRGGIPAMIRAAEATLTGNKAVHVTEQAEGKSYKLLVTTNLTETPSEAATEAALLSQKPGGIKMVYTTGVTWSEATKVWSAVGSAVTWANVKVGNV